MQNNKNQYLYWQHKLDSEIWFSIFWQWWGVFAAILAAIPLFMLAIDTKISSLFLVLAVFIIFRLGIIKFLNRLFPKKRPYQQYNFTPHSLTLFSGVNKIPNSIPSSHATSFAYFATISVFISFGVGIALLFCSLFVAAARVVLGYHFKVDVVLGLVLGIFFGVLAVTLNNFLFTSL